MTTEFGAEASLSVVIDDQSLRRARSRLESEIGATSVGVTDGGTMSAQAAGGGPSGRQRQWRRREHRWARERTSTLEDVAVYLEEIEDKVGEGGGGGGGILSNVIGDLTGAGAETVGDGVIGAGETIANAVGTAVGSAVGNAVGGTTVSVKDPSPLSVEEVGPLKVDDPSPLTVEEISGSYPVEEPSGKIPVEDPGGEYPLAEPPGPYPLETPQEPYPVEEVDPIEVEVSVAVSGGGGGSSPGGGGGSAPGQGANDFIRDVPIVGPTIAEAGKEATNTVREWGRNVPLLPEPAGDIVGPSADQGSSGTPTATVTAGQQSGGGQTIDYTDNSTIEVTVETDVANFVDDAVGELEDEYDRRLNDIENELDSLQREIKGSLSRGP